MDDFRVRRAAADDNLNPRPTGILAQPDRVALWAVFLAVIAMIAGAASAHAESSGGIGSTDGSSGGSTTGTTEAPRDASALDWRTQRATWYGPGFFGNKTACGTRLTKTTVGVAHRTLPCGAQVVLRYHGRYLRTRVIDRGPFANGAKWDLTQAAARQLRFEYTDELQVARPASRR